MRTRLGIVMDPISAIQYKKDSSLAMLLAAQARGWELYYLEPQDLFMRDGMAMGCSRALTVEANPDNWYTLGEERHASLAELYFGGWASLSRRARVAGRGSGARYGRRFGAGQAGGELRVGDRS